MNKNRLFLIIIVSLISLLFLVSQETAIAKVEQIEINICGSTGADSCADVGNPEDEIYHNLLGWYINEIGGPVVPPSGDPSKRFQSYQADNSLILFVPQANSSYTLYTEVEDGFCDDSFEILINGQGPIYTYHSNPTVETVISHTVDISSDLISTTDVEITYRNISNDGCGLAAVFNVKLELANSYCTTNTPILYKQWDAPWGDDPYDSFGFVKDYGCAMTSGAMLLNQQGVQVNPGQLNEWLRNQTDGYKGSATNWVAIARYARENGVGLYYHGSLSKNDEILDHYLCQLSIPVVTDVSGYGGTDSHFVLTTGQTSVSGISTWSINDPAFNRSTILDYGNYKSLRLFNNDKTGAILYGGSSTIEIVVTDPWGRKTGYISDDFPKLTEIPNSNYLTESIANDSDSGEPSTLPEKMVEIIDPLEGIYIVEVIGIETGNYTMHFFNYDKEQNPNGVEIVNSITYPYAVDTYRVHYSLTEDSLTERVVPIDIKPGSDLNSINCTNGNQLVTIAILTTETFDATTVDHTSISFADAREVHLNHKTGLPQRHEEDIDYDGDLDLVLHFRLGDTNLTCNSTEGIIEGQIIDGLSLVGIDKINMVEPNN